ncbi:MAG TPA: hypothetical protein VL326_23310 [Kofleriaceae bacterium]|nr:hypothetical protein [Kofleriaceae bacterium]
MTPIATDVWHVAGQPMKFPGGVRIPLASTVIRLPSGKVVVYSPGKLDEADMAAIDALGDVAYILAPNLYHHLFAGKAHERWPKATLVGAPGLAAKRSDLKFGGELGSTQIDDALDVVIVGGSPAMNEAVLFHRPTGTLVCCDWLFNVTKPANVFTSFALSLTGTSGRRLKQSRVWGWSTKDKAAARASRDKILEWPIQHIAPVHGEPLDIDRDHLKPVLRGPFKVAGA